MIRVDEELCIGCGLCEKDCVDRYIRVKKGKAKGPKDCLECGHCIAVCPKNAITLEGYDMSEIIDVPSEPLINAEDLLTTIKSRRSIRRYQNQNIEEEKLQAVLAAGKFTATAKNRQDTKLVVVQEQLNEFKELVWNFIENETSMDISQIPKELAAFYMFSLRHKKNPADDYLFRNAPAVIFLATDNSWDAGMAAQNMELMAVSMEMGVLFDGYLTKIVNRSTNLKEWLGVGETPVAAAMLVGYPDVKYRRSVPRKAEIIRK